jgi:hypothetical protein
MPISAGRLAPGQDRAFDASCVRVAGAAGRRHGGLEPCGSGSTYGVKFPMFAKTVLVGKQANGLYLSLAQATGKAPGWNFPKHLVDRQGRLVGSFVSDVKPGDATLVAAIEQALAQR